MRLFNLPILYFGLTLLLLIILPLSVFAQYGGNPDLPKAPALSVSSNVCVNGSPNINLSWSGVNQTDSFDIYRYEYTPPPGGDGLTGNYFDNEDLTNFKVSRIDPTIDFNWGSGKAVPEYQGNDNYSIVWAGIIVPKYSERYTFYLTSDDGASLLINHQTVIDNWTARGLSNKSGFLDLTASQMYNITVTYNERGSDAQVHLEWQSNSQSRQIVPKSALYSTSITGTQIASNLSQSARSYTDATALPDKLYSYRVVAVNTYGSASSSWTPYQLTQACSQPIIDNNSIISSCTSPPPPSTPAISFNFADSSPNRAFYNVYRQTQSSGQTILIAFNQAASLRSFTDNPTTNPSYPLAANTAYRYQVGGVDNLGIETLSAWSNPVSTTGCDGDPPIVTFNFVSLNACYTPATWRNSPPQPIQATATDSPAGVATVQYKVTNTNSGVSTANILADNTPPSNIYSKSLIYPTVDFSTIGGVGFSYKIEVKATDKAGNISAWLSSQPFDYHASCGTPWIQTQGGDVHSNNGINAPGGPP